MERPGLVWSEIFRLVLTLLHLSHLRINLSDPPVDPPQYLRLTQYLY